MPSKHYFSKGHYELLGGGRREIVQNMNEVVPKGWLHIVHGGKNVAFFNPSFHLINDQGRIIGRKYEILLLANMHLENVKDYRKIAN